MGRLVAVPLLVVGSAREDEPGSAAVRRALDGTAARSSRLSRLGREDVTALATARAAGRVDPALLVAAVERADGLPLLAEELVDDAAQGSRRCRCRAAHP